MTDFSFDSNILIGLLNGDERARSEIHARQRRWISRVTWIEVMSKVPDGTLHLVERLLDEFEIDEVSAPISRRAAELRRDRPRLKLADAVILASAQLNHRILVTLNTKDFPADMPGIRVPYTL